MKKFFAIAFCILTLLTVFGVYKASASVSCAPVCMDYLSGMYRASASGDIYLNYDNVNNTSDANKPVSIAQQTALNALAALIPAAQVNPDWNATSGLAQILNKPTIPGAWSVSALTLPLVGTGATGTQISNTKNASVKVSYSTQVTVTLSGSPISTVIIKTCATNSATEANWIEAGRTATTQPTTLAVTVGGVYGNTGQITADVPMGNYVKAENSGTGTHTEAFVSGQQTVYQ